MKATRLIFSFLLLWPLASFSRGWADTKEQATFSSVQGKVKVLRASGATRRAKNGQFAYPGETIQVGSKGTANLDLPDGSRLSLFPNSKLTIGSLEQPSLKDKIFSFRLGVGKVFAQVRKLLSSKSSFEIEAGGVVCGVRGTEFAVGFNPDTNQTNLDVFGGVVGAGSGGVTQTFTSGQSGNFSGGKWDGKIGTAPPPPKPGTVGTGSSGSGGTGSGSPGGNGTNGSGGTGSVGTGANGSGVVGSTGTDGNGSGVAGSTGTTDNGSGVAGGAGTEGNGQGVNSGDAGSPAPGSPGSSAGFQPNTSLGDLDNQFLTGVVINSNNNLSSAQQTIHIHLVVP